MEGWYSVQSVARATGIQERTLRNWCATKRIPSVKVGRDWKINMRELVTNASGDLADFWMQVRESLSDFETIDAGSKE